LRVGAVDVPPAIIVNTYNLTTQASYAKNKENDTNRPQYNRPFLPRLIEVGAGKVVDNGKHKNAWPPDYSAIDR